MNQGLVTLSENKEIRALVNHYLMGHVYFDNMYQVFPNVMSGVDRSKLKCDDCEYAKETRISFVSKGIRSISLFMLVHSNIWTYIHWYL